MFPKFRAWHKPLEQMCKIVAIDFTFQNVAVFHIGQNLSTWKFADIELMQWSGLQDSVGKEIFEGDIVYLKWPDGNVLAVSEYNIKSGIWHFRHLLNKDWTFFDDCDPIEIIGNIYENPELI